jgi:hypothetical protein
MTKRNISPLSSFYLQRIKAIKKTLERIEFSDFQQLPAWVKSDLTSWLGCGNLLAGRRLSAAGMRISLYKKGDVHSLFPDGMPRERRRK